MSPQRSKNRGSSQESGSTCVCERNQPRDAACRYRIDTFTAAFAGLHFCAHRAGWCNTSDRATGRTFVGRSGLVSREVYKRESAVSVYERVGREPNQQKPRWGASCWVGTDTARRVGVQSISVLGRQFVFLDWVLGGCTLESSD